jgi:NTE family protein
MIQLNLNQIAQLWGQRRARVGDGAEAAPQAHQPPRRIGLALGGGGGKGSAHLGVLQVIEMLELPIDLLVGTSAGGVVSILYAAGFSLDQISQVFRDTALRRIATIDPTRTALIGSRRLEELLRRLLGERTFADLRIPCAVVATDLVSGEQVVLDEGPLVTAILATTALPSIFPPVVRGDQLLADGGILNNLPVDLAYQMGAQQVIAVELSDAVPGFALSVAEPNKPLSRLSLGQPQLAIANRALGLLMARNTALHLADHPPALLLRPTVADIALLDMANPERGWRAGEAAALEATEQLSALRTWRLAPPEPPAPPPPRPSWSLPQWRWPELPQMPWVE